MLFVTKGAADFVLSEAELKDASESSLRPYRSGDYAPKLRCSSALCYLFVGYQCDNLSYPWGVRYEIVCCLFHVPPPRLQEL